MSRLKDKVALVTGAASGLGKAIASLFVKEGADVTITDLNEETGHRVAKEIGARFLLQDVAKEAVWQEVLTTVKSESRGLHILVNNAGAVGTFGKSDPETTTLEEWNKLMSVNVGSVFLGCKYAIPIMKDSGGGSIINMSSIAALLAMPTVVAYGASKAALCHLTKSVAIHCADMGYGIRCNSIHPGQILTPMLEGLFEQAASTAGIETAAMRQEFIKRIPLGEFGEPEDIANMALFLASEESRHVTGQQMVVDGGMQYFHKV